jgi:hypothetical protein
VVMAFGFSYFNSSTSTISLSISMPFFKLPKSWTNSLLSHATTSRESTVVKLVI